MKKLSFTPAFLFYKLFFFLLLFLIKSPIIAQPYELENSETDTIKNSSIYRTFGFNLAGAYTGSSLGLNLNPSVYYKFRKNLIAFGPNIQRARFNVSGVQGYFQHDLASSFKKMIVYYHINLLYHISANLESAPINNGPTSNLKHNAFEHYAGFGVRKDLTEQLYFDTSLGVGAYYTMNESFLKQTPLRSDNDFSLLIKLGLTYNLTK